MNRDVFDSRPWLHYDEAKDLVMSIYKGTHQGKLRSQNLDEASCILKVTGALIEKKLAFIFSKTQLFEVL